MSRCKRKRTHAKKVFGNPEYKEFILYVSPRMYEEMQKASREAYEILRGKPEARIQGAGSNDL